MNPYQSPQIANQYKQTGNFFVVCILLLSAVLAAAVTYHVGYLDGYKDGGGPPGPHYKINPNAR